MKYFGKLFFSCGLCLVVALLVLITGGNMRLSFGTKGMSKVVNDPSAASASVSVDAQDLPVLILYSPREEYSSKYKQNLEVALDALKWNYEAIDIARSQSVSYSRYKLVILASPHLETELEDDARRLFSYVNEGGRLFWGMLQDETNSQFRSVYKRMGVMDYGDYITYDELVFERELMPGVAGAALTDEGFSDAGLFLRLAEDAKVYVSTNVNDQRLPVFWTFDYGQGTVGCFNGTSIVGDFYRGFSAACMSAIMGTNIYPVINAKCIFIDDFPSPQYESTSDVVRKAYNRSVKEFYRDIWWPDMQKAANKLGYKYTGLFVATYNNIIEPELFEFEQTSMEQYYGNSLLRAGHELGAHGYNHQSLAEAGQVPEDLGYRAWETQQDMEDSIRELAEIAQELFPGTAMRTYVPPSNYLSEQGRQAVANALPELKAISGVYTNEAEDGAVYQQRFEIAPDGVAEFPRITSGMMVNNYETLEWYAALTLHGVFSHFIHPDDIFDEDRGKGQSWETLIRAFETLLEDVNKAAPSVRSLTAADAASALEVYDVMEPSFEYGPDSIACSIKQFRGEAYFFLRTEKKPTSHTASVTISPLGQEKKPLYYLVCAKEPAFTIYLEGE